MSWNHRVVRRTYHNTHMDDSMLYEIHEVYYNADGTVDGITEEPIRIREETIDDLRKTVERLTQCLTKPIIDYDTLQEIK
jgi:hypothetical protein